MSFKQEDMAYLSESPWKHRLLMRLFRKHFIRFVFMLMSRAYRRRIIDSSAMHDIAAIYHDMAGGNK